MFVETLSGVKVRINENYVKIGGIVYSFAEPFDLPILHVSASISGHFIAVTTTEGELFLITATKSSDNTVSNDLYVDHLSSDMSYVSTEFTVDESTLYCLTKGGTFHLFHVLPPKFIAECVFDLNGADGFKLIESNNAVKVFNGENITFFDIPDCIEQTTRTIVLKEIENEEKQANNDDTDENTDQQIEFIDTEVKSNPSFDEAAEMLLEKAKMLRQREVALINRRNALASRINDLSERGKKIAEREEKVRKKTKKLFGKLQSLIEVAASSEMGVIMDEKNKFDIVVSEYEDLVKNCDTAPVDCSVVLEFKKGDFEERLQRISDKR